MKYLLVFIFFIVGCATSNVPKSEYQGLGRKEITAITSNKNKIKLNEKVIFYQPGSGLMGDIKFTLFPGDYIFFGKDNMGKYYMHQGKGILRKGNLGIRELGGIYIPHNNNNRWKVWINDKSSQDVFTGFRYKKRGDIVINLSNIPINTVKILQNKIIN